MHIKIVSHKIFHIKTASENHRSIKKASNIILDISLSKATAPIIDKLPRDASDLSKSTARRRKKGGNETGS